MKKNIFHVAHLHTCIAQTVCNSLANRNVERLPKPDFDCGHINKRFETLYNIYKNTIVAKNRIDVGRIQFADANLPKNQNQNFPAKMYQDVKYQEWCCSEKQ